MSKVEKVEGNTMDCGTCGLRLICRNKTYAAYEDHPERTVPQWQNDNGGAHYKWLGPEKYKCVDTNGKDIPAKKKEEPKTEVPPKLQSPKLKEPKVGNGLVENDLMKDDEQLKTGNLMNGPVLTPLDEITTNLIHNDAILLYKTRQVIIDTVKEFEKNAHPGMIWEMTALIYNKHFGEKRHE